MKRVFYECENTGTIIEKKDSDHARFSTVKKYSILCRDELSHVQSGFRDVYGFPFPEKNKRVYLGTDRDGLTQYDQYKNELTAAEMALVEKMKKDGLVAERMMTDEASAKVFLNLFAYANEYELIWTRISGSRKEIPEGYRFIGHDISFCPECWGAFSIICDCMFICRWHGCDEEGTLFLEDFNKLNENGLFDYWQDAYDYMVKYLKEDWTERGTFGIYEVFRK